MFVQIVTGLALVYTGGLVVCAPFAIKRHRRSKRLRERINQYTAS